MKAKNFITTVLVLSFFVCLIPHLVEAGTIRIWPDQLRPQSGFLLSVADMENRYSFHGYVITGAHDNDCYLFAPVDLPAGTTVTKLKGYMQGINDTPITSVTLYRIRIGNIREEMARVQHSEKSGIVTVTDNTVDYASVKVVYRYYIEVYVRDQSSGFYGAKIIYK
jgi:hypothetical protein